MVYCPRCRFFNPDTNSFCNQCGLDLRKLFPNNSGGTRKPPNYPNYPPNSQYNMYARNTPYQPINNTYPTPQNNRFNQIRIHKALMDFINNQLNEIKPNTTVTLNRFYQVLQNEGLSKYAYYDYKTVNDIGRLVGILIKSHSDFEFDKFNQNITRKDLYSQVGISKSAFQDISDSEFQGRKEVQNTFLNLLCPYCHNEISKTNTFCPECGYKLMKCPICKGILKEQDQLGQCPNCKETFHMNHLKETVKVSGTCPICKSELKEFEIIPVTSVE